MYSLTFQINYHCLFGSSVYLIGSTIEFGRWNLKKAIRLNWSEVYFKNFSTIILFFL